MDTPRIASSAYTTTTVPMNQMIGSQLGGIWPAQAASDVYNRQAFLQDLIPSQGQPKTTKKEIKMSTRRIVQVFIADTDENVPLDKSVLFTGEQKLTDATDQELFFEIDIKNILDKHNAYRITLVNKKVKERVENLEPVKIRDLKMVVVNVASF